MSNTRRPADPPAYDLDAAIAEAMYEPFRFTFAGQQWTAAHAETLNVWPVYAAADGGDLAALTKVFELALGDQWEQFHAIPMPRHGFDALFTAYQEHSGLTPGESPASTGS